MSERMEIQSHKGIYTVEFDDASIERFAKWNFNTGFGNTIYDISGNDRNLGIVYPSGATWVERE